MHGELAAPSLWKRLSLRPNLYFIPVVIAGSNSGPTSAASALMGSVVPSSSLYNKDGHLDSSRVTALQWIPGSLTKFVAVHLDGGVFMYDTKHRGTVGTSKSGR